MPPDILHVKWDDMTAYEQCLLVAYDQVRQIEESGNHAEMVSGQFAKKF